MTATDGAPEHGEKQSEFGSAVSGASRVDKTEPGLDETDPIVARSPDDSREQQAQKGRQPETVMVVAGREATKPAAKSAAEKEAALGVEPVDVEDVTVGLVKAPEQSAAWAFYLKHRPLRDDNDDAVGIRLGKTDDKANDKGDGSLAGDHGVVYDKAKSGNLFPEKHSSLGPGLCAIFHWMRTSVKWVLAVAFLQLPGVAMELLGEEGHEMTLTVIFDFIATLCFVLYMVRQRQDMVRIAADVDEWNITASDYTIEASGFAADVKAEDVAAYFSQFGELYKARGDKTAGEQVDELSATYRQCGVSLPRSNPLLQELRFQRRTAQIACARLKKAEVLGNVKVYSLIMLGPAGKPPGREGILPD